MRKISKPTDQAIDVYEICISRVRSRTLKMQLEDIVPLIKTASTEYDEKGNSLSFFEIEVHDDVGGVSQEELEKVYTQRMVPEASPGRLIYETIKLSAPHGICPYCGQRGVKQLDHYLPKANFPSLVVTPFNLVPSCTDCNKAKLADVPTTIEEQFLHPYYDNVEDEQWLYAEVKQTRPASFIFKVCCPDGWEASLKTRVQIHFDSLELNTLYISQAAAHLADIRYRLDELYKCGGKKEVQAYLQDESNSRKRNHINSWQTALNQAMASDDWFCSGGFSHI